MAAIEEKIEEDVTAALKAGDTLARDTLRLAKTALHNRRIEKGSDLTDDDVVATLQKEVKRRQEAIAGYERAGRAESVAKEQKEKELLEKYLPAQISDDELKATVAAAIKTTGAKTAADMGKVMKEVMGKVAGRADGGKVSAIVRKQLP